MVRSNVG